MATPVCGKVLAGAGIVTLATLVIFLMYPLIAISFEAGLVAGSLLHSSHTTYAIRANYLDATERLKRKENE